MNISALVVLRVLLRTGSRIDRQPKLSGINSLADVNPADRRADVNSLVLFIRILLDIDLASRQKREYR